MTIQDTLFSLQDPAYQRFHSRLIPTVNPDAVIGVRVPALRKLARSMDRAPETVEFLQTLPHTYYEENCLHGFLIERIQDYDSCVAELNRFLPYVDNWTTCDLMSPKALKKNADALLEQASVWLHADHPYTIRFGILCLMRHFLDERFHPDILRMVSVIRRDEYYVNMAIAWFFAEALVKQYDCALEYLQKNKLPVGVHNKAIQKARESFRITLEQKAYLNTLKRKA